MPQIIDRGNDTYLVRIFLGRDSSGRRKFHSRTIHGKRRDAERYASKKQTQRDMGEIKPDSNLTLSEFLDKWLVKVAKARVRPSSFRQYEKQAGRIKKGIGNLKLSEIKPLVLEDFYEELGKALSPPSIRLLHHLLKYALKTAVKWELIPTNPALSADAPQGSSKSAKVFSRAESEVFLEHAMPTRHGVLWELALITGLRPEEYTALKWEDLDLENRKLKVRRSCIQKTGGGWYFEELKTPRAKRTLPLPSPLVARLKEHRKSQLEHKLQMGEAYREHGLVFTTRAGEPIKQGCLLDQHFRPILKSAGLPLFHSLYTLRHTYCTMQLLARVPVNTVSKRMGHASERFTVSVYGHSIPEMEEEADAITETLFYKQANG